MALTGFSMEAKLTPVNRLDGFDRESFRQMMESLAFQRVQERIAAELDRAEHTCLRADSDIELRRAQGAASALRTALTLPSKIYEEMKR